MDILSAVTWLDSTFRSFDHAILQAFHELHSVAGVFFDGFFRFITVLGNAGIFMIVVAILLALFKKTRKTGLSVGVALLIGMIITNLILKNVIMRDRPYEASGEYNQWFVEVFNRPLSDNSFPSGHATAAFAMATAIFLCGDKRYSWLVYVFAILMDISRLYLCVHYPTDVIVGSLVGILGGVSGYYIVKYLYILMEKKQNKFTHFVLCQDVISVYHFLQNKAREKCKNKNTKVQENMQINNKNNGKDMNKNIKNKSGLDEENNTPKNELDNGKNIVYSDNEKEKKKNKNHI